MEVLLTWTQRGGLLVGFLKLQLPSFLLILIGFSHSFVSISSGVEHVQQDGIYRQYTLTTWVNPLPSPP